MPIALFAKCGNRLEADDVKPSNCGKCDRQIVLMALLQKVMFDKRIMTNFLMVNDKQIMGLCGETSIANKAETFVTFMQDRSSVLRFWPHLLISSSF